MVKILYLGNEKIVAGICSGIGQYFSVDPVFVRLIWVVLTIMSFGTGIIAYLFAWIIIPEKPVKSKK